MPYRKADIGRDELEGFENYVREQYVHDLKEASRIEMETKQVNMPGEYRVRTILAVFDKLATPRVFLIDKWRSLTDEERLSYYSQEYQAKAKASSEALKAKALEALKQ